MKYLITGSCGFIGSNFVRKFYNLINEKQNFNKICSIDKMEQNFTKNNYYINNHHNFYIGDITNKLLIQNIFELEKPDYIIHFAAESHVDKSIEDPSKFINSNVLGTQVLIDAAIKFNIKKFIYVSTDEVYGQLLDSQASSWQEDALTNPRNPYSASKLSGELLLKAAHQTFGLNYIITRCCNNFGPRQSNKNFIPKIIKSIINNEKMPIYGDGKQIREWIYVEDHCKALIKLAESEIINDTFNVSTGWEMTNLEMFSVIANFMGKGHDLVEFVKDRPGHDFRYAINANKIKSIGWKPTFDFSKSIEKTVNWYMNNEWFLKC